MRRGRGAAAIALGLLLSGCSTSPSSTPPSSSQAPSASTAAGQGAPAPRLHVSTVGWRLPQRLSREAVVADGPGRVVVAGGLTPGDVTSASTYTLDLRTGRAVRGPALLTPVHDTAGATVPGARLVIGGGNATEQALVQADSGSGWGARGRLPGARSDLAAVTAGGRVYVVGGYDGRSAALADVLTSNDGRSWRLFARLPEPVRYPGVAVTGGAIWVFGGERGGAMLDTVQRVDLVSGKARVVARMPHPLGHEGAFVLGRRILLAGGRTAEHALTSRLWWFDPADSTFSAAGRLPGPRADAGLAEIGSTAYLLGGETPGFSDRVVRLAWR